MVVGEQVTFMRDEKLITGIVNAILNDKTKVVEIRVNKELFYIFREEVIKGRVVALPDSEAREIQNEWEKIARRREVARGSKEESVHDANLKGMEFILNKFHCGHLVSPKKCN